MSLTSNHRRLLFYRYSMFEPNIKMVGYVYSITTCLLYTSYSCISEEIEVMLVKVGLIQVGPGQRCMGCRRPYVQFVQVTYSHVERCV